MKVQYRGFKQKENLSVGKRFNGHKGNCSNLLWYLNRTYNGQLSPPGLERQMDVTTKRVGMILLTFYLTSTYKNVARTWSRPDGGNLGSGSSRPYA